MLSIANQTPEADEYQFGVDGVWTAEQTREFLGVTTRSLFGYVAAGNIEARRLPSTNGDADSRFQQRRFCVRSVRNFARSLEVVNSQHQYDYEFGVDGLWDHHQVCEQLNVSKSYLDRLIASGANIRFGRIADGRVRRFCVRSVKQYLAGLPE